MARQLTTKAQVNGYRFLVRRLEHALVRRDVRMLHDPMRAHLQALVVGGVLGLMLLGGCGVWALIRPQGSVGDATIVVSRTGGGTYVLVDGTLHPVLNLASARLVTGSAESPATVSDGKLGAYPRGPLLGIPGAPSALPASAHPGRSYWSVCDTARTSPDAAGESTELTVIGDRPVLGRGIDAASDDDGLLVTSGATTYLIYTIDRGDERVAVRAAVDTASVAVMRALHLEGVVPRAISPGLLNTVEEVAPLAVPVIDGGGEPGPLPSDAVRVGSVIKTVGVDDRTTYYVVLAGGVQQISEATAEILRLADHRDGAPVPALAPGLVAAVRTMTSLPVGDFPRRAPDLVDARAAGTVCQTWSRGADEPTATTRLLLGRALPLPPGATPVAVTSADGAGPGVDAVYLRPGSGEYIQVTGSELDSGRAESRYFISDVGVRFGVANAAAGRILGLGDTPARAPWSMIGLLMPGPSLSRTAALVAHDGISPDADGRAVAEPSG
ncbi:type VII secretion protein EccB [Gordonia sp. NPDC003424]